MKMVFQSDDGTDLGCMEMDGEKVSITSYTPDFKPELKDESTDMGGDAVGDIGKMAVANPAEEASEDNPGYGKTDKPKVFKGKGMF